MSPATIVVLAVLAVMFGLAVWRIVKKSKTGGCSSCGDCNGCTSCGDVHSPQNK